MSHHNAFKLAYLGAVILRVVVVVNTKKLFPSGT